MKENSDGNDTNVGSIGNSIEEDIKILEKFKNDEMQRDKLERDVRCGGWKIGDIYKCLELDNAIDNILSDYKRVLKENEILKEEKEQAWEEWNNLEQGSYGTEQKLKEENRELKAEMKDGVIVIKLYALQTENEKLKNDYENLSNSVVVKNHYIKNSIPVSLVKDKIEEIQEEGYWLFTTNRDSDKCVEVLQELLESEE